jgi:hypothetical protein
MIAGLRCSVYDLHLRPGSGNGLSAAIAAVSCITAMVILYGSTMGLNPRGPNLENELCAYAALIQDAMLHYISMRVL